MKIKAVFLKEVGKNFQEIDTKKLSSRKLDSDIRKKFENASHEIVKSKKIDITDKYVSYKGKCFIIPESIHSVKNGKTIIIYFDYDNEKFLFFRKHDSVFDSKFLDRLLNNEILGQLMGKLRSSMEKPDKTEFFRRLVVPILCLVVGFFVGNAHLI